MNYLAKARRNPWNIWDELDDLQNAVSRSFRGLDNNESAVIIPRMDAWENENELILEMELPGVAKEDVDISVTGHDFTVTGKSKHVDEKEGSTYHRRERQYREFSRTITLPYAPDVNKVKAVSKDGILTITIPQPQETKPRKIAVKAA